MSMIQKLLLLIIFSQAWLSCNIQTLSLDAIPILSP